MQSSSSWLTSPQHRDKNGFKSGVTLSSKNPKTGEAMTLPEMHFPWPSMLEAVEPTAIEARHFAATYALFRLTSMKNTYMMMPPKYKDLWKGIFTDLKKEDVAKGLAWHYDADPFLTAVQREDARLAAAKKQAEEERLRAKGKGNEPAVQGHKNKAWERAPRVEMGKRMRLAVEALIRQHAVWNPNDVSIPSSQRVQVIEAVTKLGFRKSHVQEAAELCKDKEEIIEWLLIHVPEDDLPPWSLPENYIAGVSMASSNLKREAMIKRLAAAGYARDLCEEHLDQNKEDERRTALSLQNQLLGLSHEQSLSNEVERSTIEEWEEDIWTEEQTVLASIFGDRFSQGSNEKFAITLQPLGVDTSVEVQMQKPSNDYPNSIPILTIQGKLPAYIRLSIAKQALVHAQETLLGEQMIFNLVDWLEQNVAEIIADPGRLSAVSCATVAGETSSVRRAARASRKVIPMPVDWNPKSQKSKDVKEHWRAKQSNPAYQTLLAQRKSLPAWQVQEDIVDAVNNNRVTIISGETGSGKSTQSVQFILDDLILHNLGGAANIICTQPRRISALGLADRVAEERAETVGNEVGYIIRGDSKVKRGVTRITFMTTGILLRRLQTSGGSQQDIDTALADITHVFIDEVHERNVDADFLLVLLKGVLGRRKDLKVVLMSATIDAEGFERYFAEIGSVGRVHVKGRTFPVTDYYKDDVIRMSGYRNNHMDDDSNVEHDEQSVQNALRASGMRIDYDLIRKTVEYIDDLLGDTEGGVLIFLPGTMEINRTVGALRDNRGFHVLPLHASLSPSEQKRVFPRAPRGMRKIIACTNVAETSITIPDIVAVIDTGRVKETTYDPVTSLRKLEEVWASRASCAQRRGRAGRVQKGLCFKLYTRNLEAKMRERPDPEILRVPLEQLCLSVKSMGIKDVAEFLASALTPPASQAVDAAMDLLTHVGAVEDNELTPLGKHLAMIPADLQCAKLLVLGCAFSCADACLAIAAIVSSRSPFNTSMAVRDQVKTIRFEFAPGHGDLISDLRVYEAWQSNRRKFSNRDMRIWCDENCLNMQALRDVESNRSQFVSALQEIGFLPLNYGSAGPNSELNAQNDNTALIRALILAALHPNTATITFPTTKFAASHTGALALDPEARTIKFYDSDNARVFIHPSSTCFEAKGWSSDVKFLSFFEKFRSGGDDAKPYARRVTPANVLSVLLFGGSLVVDTLGRGVEVDGWIKVRGWARIGVLVARVRRLFDGVLERRVDDPQGKLQAHEVEILDVVRRLVERDGLDR
jgi:ATP-dependent RNA helicase DHX57